MCSKSEINGQKDRYDQVPSVMAKFLQSNRRDGIIQSCEGLAKGYSVPTEIYCKRARLRLLPVRRPLSPWSVCLPSVCRRPALLTGRRLPDAVTVRVAPKVRSLGPGRRTCAGCKWRVQGGRRPALLVTCFFGTKATALVVSRPPEDSPPVGFVSVEKRRGVAPALSRFSNR